MLFCLHVEFVFMLMSFNRLTDDLLKDNPPSKLGWSIFAAQICLFCEKYENPRNLGIVRACADKSHLCSSEEIKNCENRLIERSCPVPIVRKFPPKLKLAGRKQPFNRATNVHVKMHYRLLHNTGFTYTEENTWEMAPYTKPTTTKRNL